MEFNMNKNYSPRKIGNRSMRVWTNLKKMKDEEEIGLG
jgi:hypothetical protein